MRALGRERFHMLRHDRGELIVYGLASPDLLDSYTPVATGGGCPAFADGFLVRRARRRERCVQVFSSECDASAIFG